MSSINVDPEKVKYVYTKSLEDAEADYKKKVAKYITKEADRLYDAKGFLYWRVLFNSHPQYNECLERAAIIVWNQSWEGKYWQLHFTIDCQRNHCNQMIAMANCCDHQYLTLSGDDVKSYSNRAKIYLQGGEIPLV